MFLYRLHISLFHSFYRTQHICLHPGECKHPPHETLIKERDHTAHAKDSYNGSYADSDQMMRENLLIVMVMQIFSRSKQFFVKPTGR